MTFWPKKKKSLWWGLLAVVLAAVVSCGRLWADTPEFSDYEAYYVLPADASSKADAKWAGYLYNQMSKRTRRGQVAFNSEGADKEALTVYTALRPDAPHDYAVERNARELTLTARDEATMTWLIYQFLSALGADDLRFETNDLAPAYIAFDHDNASDFAFEYRSLYTPTNASEDFRALNATSHVDYDWGLWGHNIARIFPSGKIPGENMAVNAEGVRSEEQVCLSSVFPAYEAFILDQYGPGEPGKGQKFMVLGLDSEEVCLCAECKAHGNTPASSTGSAAWLLRRLAQRFPNHRFFLGAYGSTINPPSEPLPENAGVMISALSLPMRPDAPLTKAGREFDALVERWKAVTPRLYVWDYMRDFDDYLTPYPLLKTAQRRLQHYRDLGVKGIFFNGSGSDYAANDDLQTWLLATMMINPEVDVDSCIARHFNRFYPIAGKSFTNIYRIGEDEAFKHGLPIYGGIGQSVIHRLPEGDFQRYIHVVDSLNKWAEPAERHRLNELLTALAFTSLELQRLPGARYDGEFVADRLALLRDHGVFTDMTVYREAGGNLDQYIEQWELYGAPVDNPLEWWKVTALTPLDEEAQGRESLLNDRRRGFATDYHTGWLVNSADTLKLSFVPGDNSPKGTAGRLTVGLLAAPKWHIAPSATVELRQGGKLLGSVVPAQGPMRNTDDDTAAQRLTNSRIEAVIPAAGLDTSAPFEVWFLRRKAPGVRSQGVDEIMLTF